MILELKSFTDPPNGIAMLKIANISVLISCLYMSAMIVGATHEYDASPTPTNPRKIKNTTNSYKKRDSMNRNIQSPAELTSFGTNDPANVVNDQKVTPTMIKNFRLYRSLQQ